MGERLSPEGVEGKSVVIPMTTAYGGVQDKCITPVIRMDYWPAGRWGKAVGVHIGGFDSLHTVREFEGLVCRNCSLDRYSHGGSCGQKNLRVEGWGRGWELEGGATVGVMLGHLGKEALCVESGTVGRLKEMVKERGWNERSTNASVERMEKSRG